MQCNALPFGAGTANAGLRISKDNRTRGKNLPLMRLNNLGKDSRSEVNKHLEL